MAEWQLCLVLEGKALQVLLALMAEQNDNLSALTMALQRCFRQVPVALTVRWVEAKGRAEVWSWWN